jgi:hypothetical protein
MANPPASSNPPLLGSFGRDDNYVPIQLSGIQASSIKTLTGNNTSGIAVPIFTITGSVQILGLYGLVTTTLGANNTAAYWRLNDGTAQSSITASSGTTLSAAPAGSIIVKKDLASAALTLLSASQERISEPTTLETFYFSPFVAVQKTGGVATNIEFLYSTTDTPTSGAITFYCGWLPIGAGSRVSTL